MATQQSDSSKNTGQNILLAAIIVVLIYIVLDIFGFIPSMKAAGNRNKKGGGLCSDLRCDIWLLPAAIIAAAVAGSMAMSKMG